MSGVTLSAGVRQNLLSLQNTADMMSKTMNRLATGMKVNSALDNPTNFFTSAALSTRAKDLDNLLDGISNSIKTIEAADNGIKAITRLVESAQSTAKQAIQANTDGSNDLEGGGIITPSVTGTTAKDQALNQTFNNLGAADAETIVIKTTKAGVDNTFTYTIGTAATAKISDFVAAVNASGVASAQVTDNGKLKISAASDEQIAITFSSSDASTTSATNTVDLATAIGFTSATDTGTTIAITGTDQTVGGLDTSTFTKNAGASQTTQTELTTQYNEILSQINKLSADSSYNGTNLINSSSTTLEVSFNEFRDSNKSSLTINGKNLTSSGLSLTDASDLSNTDANNRLDELTAALTTLQTAGSAFGSQLTTVQIRQDFTKESINTLQTGADQLVLADTNEEGANLLALQTRQQLSTTALSLASRQDQAVLRLF